MSASNMEESKVKLIKDRKARLEKTALAVLQGSASVGALDAAFRKEHVRLSIELAKEFIRQIDEKDYYEQA